MTQVSIIREKHSMYIPPANQGWEEKKEGKWDETSQSKDKIKVTQVSIIREKPSMFIPPTNQGWEEKEEGEKG